MIFFRWQGIVDYCVLVAALYLLLRWSREVQALRIALGLLVIRVASMLARHLGLVTTGWILDAVTLIVLVVVLVVFQSELRQAISRLDFAMRLVGRRAPPQLATLDVISQAAFSLARASRGALVVIVRRDPVSEFVTGGVPLGGRVSIEILEAVFRKVSPVHDGATVVEGDDIARVGAILPMTQRGNIPKCYGTRHRAAMGLAERCDALVVVVSEERGEVTLMQGHDIQRVGSPEELLECLKRAGAPASVPRRRLREFLFGNAGLKLAAVGLATLYWTVSFLPIGTSIRAVLVPIEFANIPPGMEIEKQSAAAVEIRLRASGWLFDSIDLARIVARFDLSRAEEGEQILDVRSAVLNLPPGFVVEGIFPAQLSIRLVRHDAARRPALYRTGQIWDGPVYKSGRAEGARPSFRGREACGIESSSVGVVLCSRLRRPTASRIAYNKASCRGGQPGMHTSTGTT